MRECLKIDFRKMCVILSGGFDFLVESGPKERAGPGGLIRLYWASNMPDRTGARRMAGMI